MAKGFLVIVLLLDQRLEVNHGVELLWCIAKQGLQIADEPVHVPLARRLVDDVLVVVVAQPPTQLLVVHLGLVFPQAPTSRNLRQSTFVSVFFRCAQTFKMLKLSEA